MKKIISVVIALAMIVTAVLALASCDSEKKTVNKKTPAQAIAASTMPENFTITSKDELKLGVGGVVIDVPVQSKAVKLGSRYYLGSTIASGEENFATTTASLWYNKGLVGVIDFETAKVGANLDVDFVALIPLIRSYLTKTLEEKNVTLTEEKAREIVETLINAIIGDAGFVSVKGGYTVTTKIELNVEFVKKIIDAVKKIRDLAAPQTDDDGTTGEIIGSSDEESAPKDEQIENTLNMIKKFIDIEELTFTVKFDKDLNVTGLDYSCQIKVKAPADSIKSAFSSILERLVGNMFGGLGGNTYDNYDNYDDYDEYGNDDIDYADKDESDDESDVVTTVGATSESEYICIDIKLTGSSTITREASADDIPDIPNDVDLIDIMDIVSEHIGTVSVQSIIDFLKALTSGALPGNLPFPINPQSLPF
ncbi:MAG: hypothetical protein IJQ37_04905 [Clostridia bacterium]|nr:hypothetical protein [Clostridia bacterium]